MSDTAGELLLEAAQDLINRTSETGGMVSGAVLVVTVITGEDGPNGQEHHHYITPELPLWTELGMLEMAIVQTSAAIETDL